MVRRLDLRGKQCTAPVSGWCLDVKWMFGIRLGVFSSLQKVFFQHQELFQHPKGVFSAPVENWIFSSIQKVFFQHLRFLSISTWSERSDRADGACGNCGNCC